MSDVDKIVKLLSDEDLERRMAAAVVLGALKVKNPGAKTALRALAASGLPMERATAMRALVEIGDKKGLEVFVENLAHKDEAVREAAAAGAIAAGDDAVALLEARAKEALTEERRIIDSVLARLGGRSALSALLDGLLETSPDRAQAAAYEVRKRVKEADKKTKRSYLAELNKFIKKKAVRGDKSALGAALKIIGYLEDERAIDVLVEHALDESLLPSVREDALIALRFALGTDRQAPEVAAALLDLAEHDDRRLAQTAIDTLANLELGKKSTSKLARIAMEREFRAARFAIEKLKAQGDKAAVEALAKIVVDGPIKKAEIAAEALETSDALSAQASVVTTLVSGLCDADHSERSRILGGVLSSVKGKLTAAHKKKLAGALASKIADGVSGYESVLKLLKDLDADLAATTLRDLAADFKKRRKSDKAEAVLGLLSHVGGASAEDKFKLAMIELKKSRLDTSPNSRARDPAIKTLTELLDEGADVGALLKKERGLELEAKYYLGFHFIEDDWPIGEELLDEVVEKGGRKKIARMAKNKRALAARDE